MSDPSIPSAPDFGRIASVSTETAPREIRLRHRLEYAPVWLAAHALGSLPRPLAHTVGKGVARLFYLGHRRLVRVGHRNLRLAFPDMSASERTRLLKRLYRHLGRQLAEFCRFPSYTRESLSALLETEGLEHFLAARDAGRGVLILTAHLGAWEVSSFAHSVNGYPLKFIVRPLDNPLVERMVNRYRGLHGNTAIGKRDFARGLLQAMYSGDVVGVLLDQNSAPPQGVFVPLFGTLACTAVGPAKIALRTGAAVVPGFTIWDEARRKYVLHFEPPLELQRTSSEDDDVLANTALFNRVLERWIARYLDQWLWIHRRWKTRPPGETAIY